MSGSSHPDSGRESLLADGEGDRENAKWERVGRELLKDDLAECRYELERALRDVEEVLRDDGQVTPEQVRALRGVLNRTRGRVENELAPVTGLEPWGSPAPRIPMGVLWEMTEHPNAVGVDPREYIADATGEEDVVKGGLEEETDDEQ